jgi:hypothetical protein
VELTWAAEGGSDETQVSAANSGGDSGTAFNTVNVGADATLVYDTAQSSHGSLSVRHATGATSATANMIWTGTAVGAPSRLWGRCYVRFSDVSVSRSIARIRSGTTQILRVQINTSGEIELRNSGNSVAATSTTVLSVDTWYRIEFDARPGEAVANELRLYVGDSTTLTESVAASDNYSAAADVTEAGFGNFANGANAPSMWYDSIQVNDTVFPGPATSTVTGVVAADLGGLAVAASGIRTVSGTAAAALGGITAATSGTRTVPGVAAAAPGFTATAAGTVFAALHNLVDDFNDNSTDTALWPSNYGTVTETGGRARVDCDVAQWSAYKSAAVYRLAESSISCRIWPPSVGGATDTAYASLLVTSATPGTDVGALVDVVSYGAGAYLGLFTRVGFSDPGAVYLPYDSDAHAWIRISESAGTVTWETAPDGSTWTVRRTADSPTWVSDTDLTLILEAHRGSGTDDYAEYDSVNVSTVAGTAAAALGFTAAASGVRTVAGAAGGGLGGLTVSAAGLRTVSGTVAAVLGGLTAAAAGVRTVTGAATSAAGFTAVAVGDRSVTGAAVTDLSGITVTAVGVRTVTGTVSALLGGFTVTAAGSRTVYGVASAPLGGLAATVAGVRTVTATASVDLGGLTASAAGISAVTGVVAAELGGLTVTVVGVRIVSGQTVAAFGALQVTAVGARIATGAAAAALGPLYATAVGKRTVTGLGVALLGGLAVTAVQQIVVRPGVHTAGAVRVRHESGTTRPAHTADTGRPVLAAATSRGV